jgi:hypothetical protein
MHENGLLLASQRIPVHPPLHRAFNSTRPVLSFKELRGKLQLYSCYTNSPASRCAVELHLPFEDALYRPPRA